MFWNVLPEGWRCLYIGRLDCVVSIQMHSKSVYYFNAPPGMTEDQLQQVIVALLLILAAYFLFFIRFEVMHLQSHTIESFTSCVLYLSSNKLFATLRVMLFDSWVSKIKNEFVQKQHGTNMLKLSPNNRLPGDDISCGEKSKLFTSLLEMFDLLETAFPWIHAPKMKYLHLRIR